MLSIFILCLEVGLTVLGESDYAKFRLMQDFVNHVGDVLATLWEEFGRLTNWSGPLHLRPKWWGKLVTELIYDTLDQDVSRYLKANKPPEGVKWFQQLTENYGVRKLVSRCYEIIGMSKSCRSINQLRAMVGEHYGKIPFQLTLYLPIKTIPLRPKSKTIPASANDDPGHTPPESS
jgi:hypothetical protein